MSISGDDDLFLQLIRKTTNWKIKYLFAKDSFVPTLLSWISGRLLNSVKTLLCRQILLNIHEDVFLHLSLYQPCHSFSPFIYAMDLISLNTMIISICLKLIADCFLFFTTCDIFSSRRYQQSFILWNYYIYSIIPL